MEQIILNNGLEMPLVGLGTYKIPAEKMTSVIGEAYHLGYRKFDTASYYETEKPLAQALRYNGIHREDVFITTKLNIKYLYFFDYWYGKHKIFNVRNFRSITSVVEDSFKNLGTDYVDLFLVHWPWPNFIKLYKVLERFYKEGRIRAIGVCSCLEPHLEALMDSVETIPAVNQIEISPLNTQKDRVKYCVDRGIHVEAMSTFSHYRSITPRLEIINNPKIEEIAEKYHKSSPQIILRWLVQQKISVIPRSTNIEHLEQNISLFDFALSGEDMKVIDSLDQKKFLNYDSTYTIKDLPAKYR